MGLEEDAIDLLEVDGATAVADGLDQGAEAEVAGTAEVSLGGAHDEGERVRGEGRVRHCDGVELGADEVGHVVGCEPGDEDGVGHAALDVAIGGQGERGQKTWLLAAELRS